MARPIAAPTALARSVLLGLLGFLLLPAPGAGAAERAAPSRPAGIPVDGEPSTPGSLVAEDAAGQLVEMPLRHTRVAVEISAFVARTVVEQVFANPFEEPVEAVYTFPLGVRAAVDDFEMIVGGRVIRGEIQRREEARRTYEAARAAGYRAALLEQERPNIFTQSVANIEPGGEVTVRIRTVETLRYEAGTYSFAFPLVVGPRYIPGGGDPGPDGPVDSDAREGKPPGEEGYAVRPGIPPDTPVTDADRITPPVLRPGFRSGHDVEIVVSLEAGVPLSLPVSPSHRIAVETRGATGARVRLARDDTIPNKDFILRWSVASEEPALGLLAHRADQDGFFSLLVQPRDTVGPEQAAPKEIVLVLDTSGSMSGLPMEASKRFVRQALRTLGPRDTFNLIRFAGSAETFAAEPLANKEANVERALGWVENLRGGGGTEMLSGFRAAFAREADPDRMRLVVFLTDGYIGNEDQVFAAIGEVVGGARIFSLGVGSSVNRYLLRGMAEIGRGSFVVIRQDEDPRKAVDRFRSWVTRPYLTDLEIDWGALPVTDLVPERIPDLYSGQTLTLVGRYLAPQGGEIVLRGKLGGRYWEQRLKVELPAREAGHASLASVWARHRITELLRETPGRTPPSTVAEVTALALEYRLMSPFTSFVAVDESEAVNPGGQSRRVHQALPMPEGVSFEGVFGPDGPGCLRPFPGPASPNELLDFERRPDGSTTVDDRFVDDLPVQGRSYDAVVSGVAGATERDGDGGSPRRSNGFSKAQAHAVPISVEEAEVLAAAPTQAPPAPAGPIPPSADPARGAEQRMRKGARQTGSLRQESRRASPEPPEPAPGPAARDERLRERALRVLADLAEDGSLSRAEGRPALAGLLGALTAEGVLSRDIEIQALGTWALAEAAIALPEDPWVGEAASRAASMLGHMALETGWPERWGERAREAEATRWAGLALRAAGEDLPAGLEIPRGAGSADWAGLRRALAAARSGDPAVAVEGSDPFARLLRALPRGHLSVCNRAAPGAGA